MAHGLHILGDLITVNVKALLFLLVVMTWWAIFGLMDCELFTGKTAVWSLGRGHKHNSSSVMSLNVKFGSYWAVYLDCCRLQHSAASAQEKKENVHTLVAKIFCATQLLKMIKQLRTLMQEFSYICKCTLLCCGLFVHHRNNLKNCLLHPI